jgi:hypothetical protein
MNHTRTKLALSDPLFGASTAIPSAALPKILLALCAVTLPAAALFWFVFSYGYLEDDAFIHLEFARSLAEGRGFAFNGHVVYGDTAPLWVLILAGIHSLGCDWLIGAKLASAVGLLVAVTGTWFLGQQLAQARSPLRFLPVAAVLVTVVNPFFTHWSFSGMESLTALGLSFWALALGLLGRPSLARQMLAALLLALGPLLRPEFMLFDALVGPPLLLRFWQESSRAAFGARWAGVLGLALLMSLPLALWSGYALETFGALVPNTNLAKRGGQLGELAPRLLSVYAVGFPVTLALLPVVTLPRITRWRVPAVVSVMLIWPLLCIGFYLANHTVVQTRYALLSMPSMSIAILWLIAEARRPRLFAGAVLAMVLAGALTIGLIVVPHVVNKERNRAVLTEVSGFIHNRIPQQAPVAVFAIGQIAFESQHPLVDTGGITDTSVIPHMSSAADTLAWAKAHGARYYITANPPEPGAVPLFAATVPYLGWTFKHSLYESQQPFAVYQLP